MRQDAAAGPVPGASLVDLCDHDPLDLDRDPRLRLAGPAAMSPAAACGPLCTPWCLAGHPVPADAARPARAGAGDEPRHGGHTPSAARAQA
jgi:hypothetical protein